MNWDKVLDQCIGDGPNDVEAAAFYCKTLLKIRDDQGRMVPFKINWAQELLFKSIVEDRWVYELKYRKVGISTGTAGWMFRKIHLFDWAVGVATQDDTSSIFIKGIYQLFYDNLPDEVRPAMEFQNRHELKLESGGYLRAGTATSDTSRGATFQGLHCTEFAQWPNIKDSIAALFNTVGTDPDVVLETTARGMNEAYDIWFDPSNGYKKEFIAWVGAPKCRLKKLPRGMEIPEEMIELAEEYELHYTQVNWATEMYHRRCSSDWNLFLQEFPPNAISAFISSGRPYFVGINFPEARTWTGYERYEEPQAYNVYTMGIDTASGSPDGDYSSWLVMNVTDPLNPYIASTFYDHIQTPEFAMEVWKELGEYNALCVPEINFSGLDLLHRLRELGWAFFYRRQVFDKVADRLTQKLGFVTTDHRGGGGVRTLLLSRMLSHVRAGIWDGRQLQRMEIIDERLQYEMNTIVYNVRGKIDHESGKHSDLVIACALALAGIDQCDEVREEITRKRPSTNREVLLFESATNKIYGDEPDDWFDEEGSGRSDLIVWGDHY